MKDSRPRPSLLKALNCNFIATNSLNSYPSHQVAAEPNKSASYEGVTMTVQAEENEGNQVEQEQLQEQEQEQPEGEANQTQEAEFSEEHITFEGASPASEDEQAEEAKPWVKELRAKQREMARQLREAQEENARLKAPAKAPEAGPKPTLADHDYDEEAFEAALTAWHERKAEHEAEGKRQQEAQQAAQAEVQSDIKRYVEQKAALRVANFADAEAAVEQALSQAQQLIIVQGSEVPAKLAYALGNNPAELQKLAAIKNPVKFAFAVAKLETKLKTEPRKGVPLPETPVKGSSGLSGASDKKLKALEEEADRTGDRTKLVAFRRELKQRQA